MASITWRVGYWALLLFLGRVAAYVPALPTNNTQAAIEGGLNVTDISQLHLRWFPNGAYSQNVSYQLAGSGSTGVSKGAFVHFSEAYANETTPPTSTPWIAMISCDFNATNASQELDVFTLARDKGAVAAVLFSWYSAACIINPEYTDPETFDQVFDIFSTQSLLSVQLIEYQFGQFQGSGNHTQYKNYDSKRLNESAAIINGSLTAGTPSTAGYLYGILQAYNATESIDDPTSSNNNNPPMDSPQSKSPKTALAMIILYAITGFVSALFCAIIISGAIRAVRNPERYGPRRHGRGGGQSRARGLTRAILDTFPVVKFGDDVAPQNQEGPERKDVESSMKEQHLEEWEMIAREIARQQTPNSLKEQGANATTPSAPSPDIQEIPSASGSRTNIARIDVGAASRSANRGEGSSGNSPATEAPAPADKQIMPAAMGRDTCPICIMDFEEGDDLRVLPCQGQHRFHQTCVDPWLLELSSSCPICRQDFLALENMLAGEPSDYSHEYHEQDMPPPEEIRHSRPESGNRFSRYLRFAMHRNNSRRGRNNSNAAPPVPSTSTSQTNLDRTQHS